LLSADFFEPGCQKNNAMITITQANAAAAKHTGHLVLDAATAGRSPVGASLPPLLAVNIFRPSQVC
jgi:hypothetical protein